MWNGAFASATRPFGVEQDAHHLAVLDTQGGCHILLAERWVCNGGADGLTPGSPTGFADEDSPAID